jgi:ribose 5-phosphate isomerase A
MSEAMNPKDPIKVAIITDDHSRHLVKPLQEHLSNRQVQVHIYGIAGASERGDRSSLTDLRAALLRGEIGFLISASGSGLGMLLNKMPDITVTTCPTEQIAAEVAELYDVNGCEVSATLPISTVLHIADIFIDHRAARGSGHLDAELNHNYQGDLQAAPYLRWPTDIVNYEQKLAVARNIASIVSPGDAIGIGSGSTAYLALRAIAERVREERIEVKVVASSYEGEIAASNFGLPVVSLRGVQLRWVVDGADEVDNASRVLKGRGGALFREKLLWASAPKIYVVADASKLVARLGTHFPVPIEVHPAALEILLAHLSRLDNVTDFTLRLAQGKDGPIITETGFLIVDAFFSSIPVGFNKELTSIPGVLETGVFEGFEVEVVHQ